MKTHKQRAQELAAENFWLRTRLHALTGETLPTGWRLTSKPNIPEVIATEHAVTPKQYPRLFYSTECHKCGGGTNNPKGPCICSVPKPVEQPKCPLDHRPGTWCSFCQTTTLIPPCSACKGTGKQKDRFGGPFRCPLCKGLGFNAEALK